MLRLRPAVMLALPLIASLALTAAPSRAAIYVYGCVMDARQESPPNASTARGAGRFVIDTDANTVTYRITFAGLSSTETLAHIHGSATSTPGVNAGVLVPLPLGNPKVGVWNYTEALEPLILGGLCYANIHTSTNGGGEIRGQIVPLNAQLDAAQETPPTASAGTGWAVFTVDTTTNQLGYYIAYAGLTGPVLSAHFHGNVLHGTPAGVKLALAVTASPMTGTVTYAEADQDALLSGRWYVNLHTSANPGGEIRGQVVPSVYPMDATQEQGVTAPGSAGFGLVAIDTLANTLSYDVRVIALSSTENGAHIHGFAAPGASAGVLSPLPAGPQKLGTWNYGATNEANVLSGLTYFNVHTLNNGGGEIRGQIEGLPGSGALLAVGPQGPRVAAGMRAAPNPFGARTSLTFELARTGTVSLAIVDVNGRVVRHEPASTFAPGLHTYEWDGRDDAGHPAAPGVYFAAVRTPDGERVTRLARLR